jgi:hypothetical protein
MALQKMRITVCRSPVKEDPPFPVAIAEAQRAEVRLFFLRASTGDPGKVFAELSGSGHVFCWLVFVLKGSLLNFFHYGRES